MKPDKSDGHEPASHSPKHGKKLLGTISVSAKGVRYFEPLDPSEGKDPAASLFKKRKNDQQDIEIQPERIGNAFHGDEVEVVMVEDKRSPRPQGEVINVVTRAKTQFVGVIEHEKGKYFLIPDDRRMYRDIVIPNIAQKIEDGTKVYVKIVNWGTKNADGKLGNPEGEILKVLGQKGQHEVEMQAIVYEKGFETGFPVEVEEEAEHIEKTEIPVPADEVARRRDFRQTLTMTIDPVDTKDFDDAISFKPLGTKDAGGFDLYEVGVHIADVSHYVREKSALDREAVKRGCSIYLVDRTVPMLPEVLSNDICSLNPDVDRLTFSAVFDINIRGEISKRWFGKTIIHSHKRFSYETAQASLNADGRDGKPAGEYHAELTTLNTIALALAKEKFAAGAIEFDKDEVKFELDPEGRPIRVYRKERLATHKLVEDFMLLANREVAEYIHNENKAKGHKDGAFIYRIHDLPDPEKLQDLSIFVRALGYDLEAHKGPDGSGRVTSKALRKLLGEVAGKPEEELIKTATIRTMAKAIYSTQNIGHFGLAFRYYTHFTSPIRRYPDLLVHRVLHRYLEGKNIGSHEFASYSNAALKSTKREILAAEAERASIKYKQVEYMSSRVGQVFDGSITGVTEWGVYVEEKETKCEGMIKIRDLGAGASNDFFKLDQKNYCLVGEKTGKKYSLGDSIRFKVTSADLEKKTLDYILA